ncbi:hypothetical protein [Bacillus cereus]|nr:hypothetical protein [Bacillus cereus]
MRDETAQKMAIFYKLISKKHFELDLRLIQKLGGINYGTEST